MLISDYGVACEVILVQFIDQYWLVIMQGMLSVIVAHKTAGSWITIGSITIPVATGISGKSMSFWTTHRMES